MIEWWWSLASVLRRKFLVMHLVRRKAMLATYCLLSYYLPIQEWEREREQVISQIRTLTEVEFKCDRRVDTISAQSKNWHWDSVLACCCSISIQSHSELDEIRICRAFTLLKLIWKQNCVTMTHTNSRVTLNYQKDKIYKYLSLQSFMKCERRMPLRCILLHMSILFFILLIIVVNSTRFIVHLSTELILNAWRLSDAIPLETLMMVDRWERLLCYNLLYLMSATWLHKDFRSHTIAQFIGLETLTNWMNGNTLHCVFFSAEVNNVSEFQSKRFPKPPFTSAQFILCQMY